MICGRRRFIKILASLTRDKRAERADTSRISRVVKDAGHEWSDVQKKQNQVIADKVIVLRYLGSVLSSGTTERKKVLNRI